MANSKIGQIERITQNRVLKLFRDKLKYTYLGNLVDRHGNSNIEGDIRLLLYLFTTPVKGILKIEAC